MASGQMAGGAVTIPDTPATQIVGGRSARDTVLIQNVHASNVLYIGPSNAVTTANGFKLLAGESIELSAVGAVFGIASAAGTDVRYLESF